MKNFLRKLKKTTYKAAEDEDDEEYVELDTDSSKEKKKRFVRTFSLDDFSDVKDIIKVLRKGYTICMINIRKLKEKDLVELKRAINKLKKTSEAVEGDIAGIGDDYIVVTPAWAEVYRNSDTKDVDEEKEQS